MTVFKLVQRRIAENRSIVRVTLNTAITQFRNKGKGHASIRSVHNLVRCSVESIPRTKAFGISAVINVSLRTPLKYLHRIAYQGRPVGHMRLVSIANIKKRKVCTRRIRISKRTNLLG